MDSALWGLIGVKRKNAELERKLSLPNEELRKELEPVVRAEIENRLKLGLKEELKREAIIEARHEFMSEMIYYLQHFVPQKEKTIVEMFRLYREALGFSDARKRPITCDDVLTRNGKEVRVEFEKTSRDFLDHGHDPTKVDLVICWVKNAHLPVEIMELSKELLNIFQQKSSLAKVPISQKDIDILWEAGHQRD